MIAEMEKVVPPLLWVGDTVRVRGAEYIIRSIAESQEVGGAPTVEILAEMV